MASSVSRSLFGRLIFSGRRTAALGAPAVLRRTFTEAVARGPAPRSASFSSSSSSGDLKGMGFYRRYSTGRSSVKKVHLRAALMTIDVVNDLADAQFKKLLDSLIEVERILKKDGMLRGVISCDLCDPCEKTESNLCNGSLLINNDDEFEDYIKNSTNKLHKLFYVHIPADNVEGLKIVEKLPNLIDEISKVLYTIPDIAEKSVKCTFEALDEYPSIRIVIECDMKNLDDNSKGNLDQHIQMLAAQLFLKNGFELGKRPDKICDTSKTERELPGMFDPSGTSDPAIQ